MRLVIIGRDGTYEYPPCAAKKPGPHSSAAAPFCNLDHLLLLDGFGIYSNSSLGEQLCY